MKITIKSVDYSNKEMRNDLIYLLNHYALDPMGGAQGLSDYVKDNLLNKLAAMSHAFSFIIHDYPVKKEKLDIAYF
ncbi:hypothetical protein PQO01_15940 [Lentisphaera marina]|uniref:hypothetical protein n=1 Tax=Lentisphaera marina TaxID=1111041 RepID=UPI00236569BF|nr:hypothetical protein [Lentisphaera marina]MDD7986442.1 hypothetical protein [Lentisphaera marina]